MLSRLKLVDPKTATGEVRKIYDEIEEARGKGKTNTLWMSLANNPGYMRAHWEYNKANKKKGRVSNRLKESISVAVSRALGCKI
jgi:hypothetical protein